MVNMTKDYSKFKIRSDNRPLCQTMVRRIKNSIIEKNMLEFRPIVVNAQFEVIDGQHRLQAAKELDIPIYYEVQKDLKPQDMIALNVSRQWGLHDYFNFWKNQGKDDYLKLQKFIDENKITLRVALQLIIGPKHDVAEDFRNGKFVFSDEMGSNELSICHKTIEFITKNTKFTNYVASAKFWKALILLQRAPNFSETKWFLNLSRLSPRLGARVCTDEYLKLYIEIHNYRNKEPINFHEINKTETDE